MTAFESLSCLIESEIILFKKGLKKKDTSSQAHKILIISKVLTTETEKHSYFGAAHLRQWCNDSSFYSNVQPHSLERSFQEFFLKVTPLLILLHGNLLKYVFLCVLNRQLDVNLSPNTHGCYKSSHSVPSPCRLFAALMASANS